jgi:hypothetical protein
LQTALDTIDNRAVAALTFYLLILELLLFECELEGHAARSDKMEVVVRRSNDPAKREGACTEVPPSPAEYRKLSARVVDLHPMTIIQNARTSGDGVVSSVPCQALSVPRCGDH